MDDGTGLHPCIPLSTIRRVAIGPPSVHIALQISAIPFEATTVKLPVIAEFQDLATATIAMLEGFWADYFLYVDRFDRAKAEQLVMMLLEPYWE